MGACSCLGESIKDTPNTLTEAVLNSESPIGITYKIHESDMVPEIKELYTWFLLGKKKSIVKVEILDKELAEIGSDILSKILPVLQNLQELILANNGIGCKGAKKLSESLSSLIHLKKLYIKSNFLTDEGLEFICCAVPFLINLREISFYQNEITNLGAEHLKEALMNLEYLETLDLTGNSINKRGLVKIANTISYVKTLKEFNFDKAELKDSDVIAIKKILPLVFDVYHDD